MIYGLNGLSYFEAELPLHAVCRLRPTLTFTEKNDNDLFFLNLLYDLLLFFFLSASHIHNAYVKKVTEA